MFTLTTACAPDISRCVVAGGKEVVLRLAVLEAAAARFEDGGEIAEGLCLCHRA